MSFERTTPCGVISGTTCQWPGIAAYKGIRYATAGRWEFPVPVTHWDGVYDATQYGACCYQPRAFYDEAAAPGKAFYYNEFRKGETYTYSEDCLFLNIWAPADAAPEDRLPVIFYIHGGGFTGGCGHEKHFDGPVWPTKGCVAVTINYRLGPMGFVCLPELADEAGFTGNYAFLDLSLIHIFSCIRTIPLAPESHRVNTLAGGRGLYRQWGISPRPETNFLAKSITRLLRLVNPFFICPARAGYGILWDRMLHFLIQGAFCHDFYRS